MRMKVRLSSLAAILATLGAVSTAAHADNAAAIVIRGRADVPVLMYGRDISGAVIEGDWGLYRPGAVAPTIIPTHAPAGWDDGPYDRYAPYFPATGRKPRSGRREAPASVRRETTPAQSYFRSFGAASDPVPASSSPPYDMRDLPPVILAPRAAHGPRANRRPVRP